jgi:hypothetical protein
MHQTNFSPSKKRFVKKLKIAWGRVVVYEYSFGF